MERASEIVVETATLLEIQAARFNLLVLTPTNRVPLNVRSQGDRPVPAKHRG
jgi:hypothetical protein